MSTETSALNFPFSEDPAVLSLRARLHRIQTEARAANQRRGERLRLIREHFKLTRADAGKLMNVNTSSLTRAENGNCREPMEWVFERASIFFGVSRAWFDEIRPFPRSLPEQRGPVDPYQVPRKRVWKGKAKRAKEALLSAPAAPAIDANPFLPVY